MKTDNDKRLNYIKEGLMLFNLFGKIPVEVNLYTFLSYKLNLQY